MDVLVDSNVRESWDSHSNAREKVDSWALEGIRNVIFQPAASYSPNGGFLITSDPDIDNYETSINEMCGWDDRPDVALNNDELADRRSCHYSFKRRFHLINQYHTSYNYLLFGSQCRKRIYLVFYMVPVRVHKKSKFREVLNLFEIIIKDIKEVLEKNSIYKDFKFRFFGDTNFPDKFPSQYDYIHNVATGQTEIINSNDASVLSVFLFFFQNTGLRNVSTI